MKQLQSILLTLLLCLALPLIAIAADLTDLSGHWSQKEVNKLIQLEAISGYPDGTFRPDNQITRAEFATILCKSLGLAETTAHNVFADTENHWAQNVISTLVENSILYPAEYPNSCYQPNTDITRREIAIMLVRAMGLNEMAINASGQDTGFADQMQMNSYDTGYILLAKQHGLIGGYEDNTFRPEYYATRAESSVMIIRMLGLADAATDNNAQTGNTPTVDANNNQTVAGSIDQGNQNNVAFTIGNISSSKTSNTLGEQYLSITFDLTIQNQSNAALQSTNTNMKILTTYTNGQAQAKIDPYQDTIAAASSKTRRVTAHILLPTTAAAQMTLGTQIQSHQAYFTDQPVDSADIATTVNSSTHTVYFNNLATQLGQFAQ